MHSSVTFSSLDTVLLMAPFAILLVSAVFRLDERIAGVPIRGRHHRPSFCEVDLDGRGELRDPDGKPPKRDRAPQRPARGRGNRFVTRYDRPSRVRRADLD
jgi:hypothetical protein